MMASGRFRRTVRYAILISTTLVTLLGVANWAERKRDAQEEYAVYSAYLSEEILNDAHDWSVDSPIQVVVINRTKSGGASRPLPSNLLDRRIAFRRPRKTNSATHLLPNFLSYPLVPNISFPTHTPKVTAA